MPREGNGGAPSRESTRLERYARRVARQLGVGWGEAQEVLERLARREARAAETSAPPAGTEQSDTSDSETPAAPGRANRAHEAAVRRALEGYAARKRAVARLAERNQL